jgi:spore coat protein A
METGKAGRKRLWVLSIVLAALLAAGLAGVGKGKAYAGDGVSPPMTPWIDALPIPPVATTTYRPVISLLADYYEIAMTQHEHQFHSELGPATVWTYGMRGQPGVFMGPTIVAKTNRPVIVKWFNELPNELSSFPLKDAIDDTLPGWDLPTGRAIPHLHGGHTAARYDGTPDQWWTADGEKGMAYVTDTFTYVNDQPASLLWYHDHAMGQTRLNPYLGLAAAYLILDNVDNGTTINGQNVPSGPYHIPVVLQDKTFNDDGTLWYPTEGISDAHPVWVPEFFADTPVLNGKAYPHLDVQPRRYRFRFLNGSQARFYNLAFTWNGRALPFYVIGSEGGLLPAPVKRTDLLVAPGERFDVIADFTGLPLHSTVMLTNDAPAPYPDGGDTEIPELMQIRVTDSVPANDPDRTVSPAKLKLPAKPRLVPTPRLADREIVLKENADEADNPLEVLLNGYHFADPVTDFVKAGTTETWDWINLTGDAHPMHVHLVSFQVLGRQPFDCEGYDEAWQAYLASGRDPELKPVLKNFLTGKLVPPDPEEMGYKDTVKAYPGYVTKIRAKFDLPATSILDFDPKTRSFGDWVYHCHILEHEENDMMRPFRIVQ